MRNRDIISKILVDAGNIVRTIAKIVKNGYSVPKLKRTSDTCLFILGGPSLKDSNILSDELYRIKPDIIATNNYCSTKFFQPLKPKFIFVMDRAFWDVGIANLENAKYRDDCFSCWATLENHGITVVAPAGIKNLKKQMQVVGNAVGFQLYNMNWLREGTFKLTSLLLDWGLGTLAPFSVPIVAMPILIKAGYKKIILVGADHSWHETIAVDDENRLCFKKSYNVNHEGSDELVPMLDYDNKQTKISEYFNTYYHVFKSYEFIEKYARRKGVSITNASGKSYIDAFERQSF